MLRYTMGISAALNISAVINKGKFVGSDETPKIIRRFGVVVEHKHPKAGTVATNIDTQFF